MEVVISSYNCFVCKYGNTRKTKRNSEVLVAVNREYGNMTRVTNALSHTFSVISIYLFSAHSCMCKVGIN